MMTIHAVTVAHARLTRSTVHRIAVMAFLTAFTMEALRVICTWQTFVRAGFTRTMAVTLTGWTGEKVP